MLTSGPIHRRRSRRSQWPRRPLHAALTIAALALIWLGGCGGGSDADPQQVLADALGGGEGVSAGVLEGAISVESGGEQAGTLRLDVSGPFDASDPDQIPSLDLDVDAEVESDGGSFGFEGGLTMLSDGLYIGFSGQQYEVDEATFSRLRSSYEQAAAQRGREAEEDAGSLAALGLDPASWVSQLSDEGTTDLDGEEYLHVSGEVDVPVMLADLARVAARTGDAEDRKAARALGELNQTIDSVSIDVYATEDEHVLRRVDLQAEIADDRTGPVSVGLELGIDDPGSRQLITAPGEALPLSQLLAQLPGGAQALGALGAAGGLGAGGGAAALGGGKEADRYYDCVAEAKTDAEVDACADRQDG